MGTQELEDVVSNRTIIELNHDYCPHNEKDAKEFGIRLWLYIRSGDSTLLPLGVRSFGMRHHTENVTIAVEGEPQEATERAKL